MIADRPGASAEPFHDILDGYFTLKESVRQMMARHDFIWAWLVLCHAPIMEIEGLDPDAPVPLHLREGYAGVIDSMLLTVTRAGGPDTAAFTLIGTGDWRWLDDRAEAALPADIRLGEPAYLTGFGLSATPGPDPKRIPASEVLAQVPALVADTRRLRSFSA
ncbi:hypothetical protein [Aquicoccus sp. SU-CL01552]|uniref:hypothetical protein n=1 Tax=Aquicoccus sp. SU-CL01552 TaxID=3127656 RepID=UPI0031091DF5